MVDLFPKPNPINQQLTEAKFPARTPTLDSDHSIILDRKDENKFAGIVCNTLEDVAVLLRDYETGPTAEHIIEQMYKALSDSSRVKSYFDFNAARDDLFEQSRFAKAYIEVIPKDGKFLLKVGSAVWGGQQDPITRKNRETSIMEQRPLLKGLESVSSVFSLKISLK